MIFTHQVRLCQLISIALELWLPFCQDKFHLKIERIKETVIKQIRLN